MFCITNIRKLKYALEIIEENMPEEDTGIDVLELINNIRAMLNLPNLKEVPATKINVNEILKIPGLLDHALYWADTPQGHTYWSTINIDLLRLHQEGEHRDSTEYEPGEDEEDETYD